MAKEIILKKEEAVKAAGEKFAKAKSIVAFDYQGLTVAAFMQLRRTLLKNGCEIVVLKNNISRRAAEAAGYSNFAATLKGPKAIAFSYEDQVAAAREINKFAQDNKQVILGAGVVDGKEVSVEEMAVIATLPSRETLLTQLAAGMLGTLTQLAIGLNMLTEKDAE
jgi:large subunit ribosomal protein L10